MLHVVIHVFDVKYSFMIAFLQKSMVNRGDDAAENEVFVQHGLIHLLVIFSYLTVK